MRNIFDDFNASKILVFMISDNFMSLVVLESDWAFENEINFFSLFSLCVNDISIVEIDRCEVREYLNNTVDWLENEQMESADHFVVELDH